VFAQSLRHADVINISDLVMTFCVRFDNNFINRKCQMNVRKSVPQIIVTNNSKIFNKIKKVNNLILVTFFFTVYWVGTTFRADY
jgi:hypothetical protein